MVYCTISLTTPELVAWVVGCVVDLELPPQPIVKAAPANRITPKQKEMPFTASLLLKRNRGKRKMGKRPPTAAVVVTASVKTTVML